jgi:cold shock CspA family protein
MSEEILEEGRIVHWSASGGFGFIARRESKDLFVHFREIRGRPSDVAIGTRVRFREGRNPRNDRMCAVDVEMIDAPARDAFQRDAGDAGDDKQAHDVLASAAFLQK